jgi:hypothetical protein
MPTYRTNGKISIRKKKIKPLQYWHYIRRVYHLSPITKLLWRETSSNTSEVYHKLKYFKVCLITKSNRINKFENIAGQNTIYFHFNVASRFNLPYFVWKKKIVCYDSKLATMTRGQYIVLYIEWDFVLTPRKCRWDCRVWPWGLQQPAPNSP